MFRKAFWLFGLAVLMLFLFLPGYTKLQELRDKNRDLEDRIKKLDVENALLSQELSRIENDSLYQEKIARETVAVYEKAIATHNS